MCILYIYLYIDDLICWVKKVLQLKTKYYSPPYVSLKIFIDPENSFLLRKKHLLLHTFVIYLSYINFIFLILTFIFLQMHFTYFYHLQVEKLSYMTFKIEIFSFTEFTFESVWKHLWFAFVESSSETTCDEKISPLQAQGTQSASITAFHLST